MISAHDDRAGVTAEFNLNILRRLNREPRANFNLATFRHKARWNADENRVEMHLRSEVDQSLRIGDTHIHFRVGETIHTENCRKYTKAGLHELARASGWKIDAFHTGSQVWLAIVVFSAVQGLPGSDW